MKALISTLFIVLMVSACSNKAPSIKQYYRLSPDYAIATPESKRSSVVIPRPKTLGILAGRPMVATKQDGALVQLNNHYWLESPTVLLHTTLKDWAQQHWQQIQISAAFDERHERLDSKILAFEKNGNQANVSLQFILRNANGELLFDKTFQQNQTIQGDGYAHFVTAINLAVSAILNKLSQELDNLQ